MILEEKKRSTRKTKTTKTETKKSKGGQRKRTWEDRQKARNMLDSATYHETRRKGHVPTLKICEFLSSTGAYKSNFAQRGPTNKHFLDRTSWVWRGWCVLRSEALTNLPKPRALDA